MNRIVEGIFSVILSCRKHPYIRYSKHSNRATKLADSLNNYISTEDEFVAKYSKDDEK